MDDIDLRAVETYDTRSRAADQPYDTQPRAAEPYDTRSHAADSQQLLSDLNASHSAIPPAAATKKFLDDLHSAQAGLVSWSQVTGDRATDQAWKNACYHFRIPGSLANIGLVLATLKTLMGTGGMSGSDDQLTATKEAVAQLISVMKLGSSSQKTATNFLTDCLMTAGVKTSDIVASLSTEINHLGAISEKDKQSGVIDKGTVLRLGALKKRIADLLKENTDASATGKLTEEARQSIATYLATAHLAVCQYLKPMEPQAKLQLEDNVAMVER
ncbi:uncharacterized protein MKK02DRAFT_38105 [Dioszegia hungarica]|uniref:Uncharacterized protein n=1 Tax=Dioszegia hungarica TaxID=4972 RepID=A0AA38LU48_9TREE|nr:uncharacterized protein MKK02DRAFT_38105 [Dioszegia hungarica]KAI9633451.1 hypothetical protein MKK02DRAFT_38105 [Dioszegia hungarica]